MSTSNRHVLATQFLDAAEAFHIAMLLFNGSVRQAHLDKAMSSMWSVVEQGRRLALETVDGK